jgi:hypothetical protein
MSPAPAEVAEVAEYSVAVKRVRGINLTAHRRGTLQTSD